ncbi:N-acetylglucosamine-6-phosphate deacetylase [uncultured Microbacterium sp.]|uniref:N-acetylglucosamine-6-phosphate deacetylase n=1 Tax=uncultured Microbacterium sp. TaxID=191216 RepID=UPI0028D26DCC|nr:N-acetylglucosamine-6-phosphate deacetylase [uncultured Microbacterium sp.]
MDPHRPDEALPSPTVDVVDLHCHGAVGHSFDDADLEGLAAAVAYHRAHGTSRLLLSLVSAPLERTERRLRQLREVIPALPGVAGVHLEGPFLAHSRRGAHDAQALISPTASAVDRLLTAADGIVRQVTIAPELPGAMDAIDALVSAGVTVAVGHTQADHDTAAAAFDRGARLLTHAFNAMPGLGHRAVGPVGAALERDHVVLEVVADGVHLHPVVIRTVFAAAPGRVALVTDAMSATGLGDGNYRLGGLEVEVNDGRPTLTGTDILAGSTLTMERAIAVATAAGVSPDDARYAATAVPARVLDIR